MVKKQRILYFVVYYWKTYIVNFIICIKNYLLRLSFKSEKGLPPSGRLPHSGLILSKNLEREADEEGQIIYSSTGSS